MNTSDKQTVPDYYGKYSGSVKAEFLADGRKMKLLEELCYFDPTDKKWIAPNGWVVDGASIPQPAWSISGGPFEGLYRDASVIHDVGCDQKVEPWQAVHEVFYWAMRASGVSPWRAKAMYSAVYNFGPRWPLTLILPDGPKFELDGSLLGSGSAQGPTSIQIDPSELRLSGEEFGRLKDLLEESEEEWPLSRIREVLDGSQPIL